MQFEFGDVSTWFSAVVAIVAALYSYRASERAHKQAEIAQTLLNQQTELSQKAWMDQHFSGVRVWATDVCHTISEAIHLIDGTEAIDLSTDRRRILHDLSAHLDTGRWYFPNEWQEDYGTDNPPAYRGFRRDVLDCIHDAYEKVKELGSAGADTSFIKDELRLAQRSFVSHIQIVIDPVGREAQIEAVKSQFSSASKMRK